MLRLALELGLFEKLKWLVLVVETQSVVVVAVVAVSFFSEILAESREDTFDHCVVVGYASNSSKNKDVNNVDKPRLRKKWRLYIFPVMHCGATTKANGCLLKDRLKAGGRLVYSAKVSHYWVTLYHLYSVIINSHWQCILGKCTRHRLSRNRGLNLP